MKMKFIAAAVAAFGTASAFAAPLNPATAVVAPANYIYIAGASAQSQALNAVAKSLFDVPADVVQITAANAGTCAGQDNADIQKHTAFLGVKGGVNTLIVYRNNGGSGAGLLQLLAKTTAAPQIALSGKVINLPASAVAGAAGSYTATSQNCAVKLPQIALQDVRPAEHAASVVGQAGTSSYNPMSSLQPVLNTGLQGFGVAVSASLYNALVAANTAAGIPLVNGVQPSIRKADYASLISATGAIKSAADFLRDAADGNTIEVARRVDTSGTQASSNLYFLSAKTAGEQLAVAAADLPLADIAANGIAVTEGASTGNVKTRLNTAGYVIGVVSLENVPGGSDTWKFVAIDGVSPTFSQNAATGALAVDPFQRQQLASGDYDFGYESFVAYKSASDATLAGLLASKIKDTANSNLVGYAYLNAPGTWAQWDSSAAYVGNTNKQSRVSRSSVNLNPLMP